jgi:hypothetical protein
MPRRATRKLEPFLRAIARETVKAAGDRLPSAGEVRRLSARMRELEMQVRKLSRRVSSKPGARAKGRPGRPRVNPVTCTVRGCQDPARAKKMCSRHYQAARRNRVGGKKSGRRP